MLKHSVITDDISTSPVVEVEMDMQSTIVSSNNHIFTGSSVILSDLPTAAGEQ